jgi:hypothetical protein
MVWRTGHGELVRLFVFCCEGNFEYCSMQSYSVVG